MFVLICVQEMASRESKRVQVAHQRRRLGLGTHGEELFHQEPDGAQADRCIIC